MASLSLPDRGKWLRQGRDCVARNAENVICPFTEKVGRPYLNAGCLHSCMKRMPSSQGLLTNHQGCPEAFASRLYRGLGGAVCSGEGLSLPAAQSQCALLIEGQTVLRVCDSRGCGASPMGHTCLWSAGETAGAQDRYQHCRRGRGAGGPLLSVL